MSLLTTTRRKQVRSLAHPVAIMLLSFYVISSQLSLLHEFIHSHSHTISHTEADEEDLCHRAVYHNDSQRSCGHHSHIVVADKCELCDSISHADQIFLSNAEGIFQRLFLIDFTLRAQEVLVCFDDSGLLSRAPPAV